MPKGVNVLAFNAARSNGSHEWPHRGNPLKGLHCFQPNERLRSHAEYQRVKQTGRRFRTAHFGVNFIPNTLPYHRLGMVVQKRFWCSVFRNRVKRCLREWFRLYKHQIPQPGKDIVVIARPGAERLSPNEIAREILAAFARQDDRNS